MKKSHFILRASLSVFLLAASSFAANDLLVRVDPSVANSVAKQYGLKIEKQLKASDGIFLVSVPGGASSTAVLQLLKSNPQVLNAELNEKVVLTKNPKAVQQRLPQNN